MLKSARILMLILLLSSLWAGSCNAESLTTINDLVENAARLNNTEVAVQGEVIGEALERGDYAWVNLSDGTNAIGVWAKQRDLEQIHYYGDYKHKGDIVKVTGVFSKACLEHGGDVDLHSSKIEIVKPGHAVTEQPTIAAILLTSVLAALTAVIAITYFIAAKKYSKKQ